MKAIFRNMCNNFYCRILLSFPFFFSFSFFLFFLFKIFIAVKYLLLLLLLLLLLKIFKTFLLEGNDWNSPNPKMLKFKLCYQYTKYRNSKCIPLPFLLFVLLIIFALNIVNNIYCGKVNWWHWYDSYLN